MAYIYKKNFEEVAITSEDMLKSIENIVQIAENYNADFKKATEGWIGKDSTVFEEALNEKIEKLRKSGEIWSRFANTVKEQALTEKELASSTAKAVEATLAN